MKADELTEYAKSILEPQYRPETRMSRFLCRIGLHRIEIVPLHPFAIFNIVEVCVHCKQVWRGGFI